MAHSKDRGEGKGNRKEAKRTLKEKRQAKKMKKAKGKGHPGITPS